MGLTGFRNQWVPSSVVPPVGLGGCEWRWTESPPNPWLTQARFRVEFQEAIFIWLLYPACLPRFLLNWTNLCASLLEAYVL